MQTKSEVRPVVHAPIRVVYALRDRLKAQLNKEEPLGVIVKVDEPTEWVNFVTIVEKKSGSLRFCLHPRDLKKVLRCEY